MTLNISKSKCKKILQYVLIYLLFAYTGMPIVNLLSNDVFYMICLSISMLILILIVKKINKYVVCFIILTIISLLSTNAYTGGSLSIGTTLTIISRLLIVYVAINVDKDEFLNRFLRLSYIFSIISLVIYFLILILGDASLRPIYSKLYNTGHQYGLFFIRFNTFHIGRNCGMFGEPGQYQVLLTTSLFFTLFKSNNLEQHLRLKYIIILIITIITCQSTTGYIGLFSILLIYMISPNIEEDKGIKKLIIFAFLFLIFYIVLFVKKDSSLYYNMFGKILTENNQLDLSGGSGGARTNSIISIFSNIAQNPRYLMGIGYNHKLAIEIDGCSGILGLLISTGIFTFSIIYGYSIVSLYKHKKNILEYLLCIFLIINTGLSQPNILHPILLVLSFYDEFINKKGKLNLEINK